MRRSTFARPHEVFGPEPGFAETARFIKTAELIARGRAVA